jgi:hypothetical protein
MDYKIKNIPYFFGFTGFTWFPYVFSVKGQVDLPHEEVHLKQQEPYYRYGWHFGIVAWMFLYFCCLPYRYHYWRTKWELEAYTKGSKLSEARAQRIIDANYYREIHIDKKS